MRINPFKRLVLQKTLEKELLYEKSMVREMKFLDNFLNQTGFDLVINNSVKQNLVKRGNPYTIEVEFYSREPDPKQEPESDEEDSKEEQEASDLCNFYITVHKPHNYLNIECHTENSQIILHDLLFTQEKPQDLRKLFQPKFPGVNFNMLNPTIQKQFVEWLQEIGIHADLAKFIEIQSLIQEQNLYLYWLDSTMQFLNTN